MNLKLTTVFSVVVLYPSIALAQPISPSDVEDCCDETRTETTDLDRGDVAVPATVEMPANAPALTPVYEPPQANYHSTAELTTEGKKPGVEKKLHHGFRIGWGYIMNYDKPIGEDQVSLKDKYDLKSASSLILGYEAFYRLVGHSWLNVIFVGNLSVAGVEQSKFIPVANGLIGFEFNESFQLGVGVNLVPVDDKPAHMITAAGWTPNVGDFQMPIHFYFIPDVDKNHRMGATIGVNW